MPDDDLLTGALIQRHEKFAAESARCQTEFSPEAVHDLRVAARRLLALLDLLRAIDTHLPLKKLRRAFKNQLDGLDDLRDTQVMLATITEQLAALPGLAPLQASLHKKETRLLAAAAQHIAAFPLEFTAAQVEKIRIALETPENRQELPARLPAAVDGASQAVKCRMARVDPARSASLHRVRIAFKKFRYMVEIIHPALPGFPQAQLKRMHAYQTTLGDIQDAEVLLRTLAQAAKRHPDWELQPARILTWQRHAGLINTCLANLDEFSTFWRPTPEAAFPWQKPSKEPA